MIHGVGQGQIIGGTYASLVQDGTTEDGLIKHLLLPWDTLATLVAVFNPEPEKLLRRHQAVNEGFVVKSQASDVSNDTEHRLVIEIERVRFPVGRISGRRCRYK